MMAGLYEQRNIAALSFNQFAALTADPAEYRLAFTCSCNAMAGSVQLCLDNTGCVQSPLSNSTCDTEVPVESESTLPKHNQVCAGQES